MADLLTYAAIKAQKDLLFPDDAAGDGPGVYDLSSNTSETNTTQWAYPTVSSGGEDNVWRTSLLEQWSAAYDQYTQPATNSLCITDYDSGSYRCQRYCCWVVPSGVSRVTFQLWGAGSGSSQMCCCGMSPAGINGSYSMFQVDVCPGEAFCVCTGCAYCCCASMTEPGGYTGTCGTAVCYLGNLNGGDCAGGNGNVYAICSPGADCMHPCLWHCQTCKNFPGYSNTCNLEIPDIAENCGVTSKAPTTKFEINSHICSLNVCSGCWAFCWDTQADDMYIPPIFGCRKPFHNANNNQLTDKNAIFLGHPTLYPEVLIGCDINSPGAAPNFTMPGPVYGWSTCLATSCGTPQANSYQRICSSTCGGHCSNANNGGLCVPSMGATGSKIFGGNNAGSYTGGMGRTGMVCISWECD